MNQDSDKAINVDAVTPKDWRHETWCQRPVTEPALAAYVSGRTFNCFHFHAQQAFVLSLRNADSVLWEPHRAAAQTAVAKLASLMQHVDLDGDGDLNRKKVVRWFVERFNEYREVWQTDPVGEFDGERADRELADPEERCSDPIERWRQLLEFTGQIQLHDEWHELAWGLSATSTAALRLGSCLDRLIRPSAVFRYQLASGRSSTQSGADAVPTGESTPEICPVSTRGPHVPRSIQAGGVPPEEDWPVRLRDALNDMNISLPQTWPVLAEVPTRDEMLAFVERLDSFVWSQLDSSLPKWDPKLRCLFYRGESVKDFRRVPRKGPGAGRFPVWQEDIINRFHELGWPPEIDASFFGIPLGEDCNAAYLDDQVQALNKINGKRRVTNQLPIIFRYTRGARTVSWRTRPATGEA
jgi:hypothetical protein